jgi:dTMP kinase
MPLISFEGLDGAGKSTAIKYAASFFDDPLILREPGGTGVGEEIRSVLKGETSKDLRDFSLSPLATRFLNDNQELVKYLNNQDNGLNPILEVLLFNLSRAELIDLEIKPALGQKRTVILDRFIDSTIAYQGYGHGLDIDWVREVSLKATDSIEPDLTFYLKMSPNTRHLRMANRGQLDRIEGFGDNFFERVFVGFNELSNQERFLTINSEKGIKYVQKSLASGLIKKGLIDTV